MLSLLPPGPLHVLCPPPGSLFLQMAPWLYLTVFRSLLKCLLRGENVTLTTPGKREKHTLALTQRLSVPSPCCIFLLAVITADRVIDLFTLRLPIGWDVPRFFIILTLMSSARTLVLWGLSKHGRND